MRRERCNYISVRVFSLLFLARSKFLRAGTRVRRPTQGPVGPVEPPPPAAAFLPPQDGACAGQGSAGRTNSRAVFQLKPMAARHVAGSASAMHCVSQVEEHRA